MKHKVKGFTIVELLIVIVVVGILAAITVIAYNGIQNRAKNAQYLSDATTIAKKAEIYPTASGTGSYPLASAGPDATTVTSQTLSGQILTAGMNVFSESRLPTNIVIFAVTAGTIPTNAQAAIAINASSTVRGYFVRYCATGRGMYVHYPDLTATTSANAPAKTVGVCP